MIGTAFPTSVPVELLTIGDWWRYSVSSLERAEVAYGQGTTSATDDASFLVLGALSLPLDAFDEFRAYALAHDEKQLLFSLLKRRCTEHIPVAYLLGFTQQLGYRFSVDERVLIPRSYLGELLVNRLAPWLPDQVEIASILDLCTGSGCLAVIAADAFAEADVFASDVSPDAIAVANTNIAAYGLDDVIDLRQGDLFAPWTGQKFDVIVSNPPYVTDDSMAHLPREFMQEPALALAAGSDGCDVLERMLAAAAMMLNDEGQIFVDVGHNRELVEARFPRLAFNWLVTEGAEDGVFMLRRDDLLSV